MSVLYGKEAFFSKSPDPVIEPDLEVFTKLCFKSIKIYPFSQPKSRDYVLKYPVLC